MGRVRCNVWRWCGMTTRRWRRVHVALRLRLLPSRYVSGRRDIPCVVVSRRREWRMPWSLRHAAKSAVSWRLRHPAVRGRPRRILKSSSVTRIVLHRLCHGWHHLRSFHVLPLHSDRATQCLKLDSNDAVRRIHHLASIATKCATANLRARANQAIVASAKVAPGAETTPTSWSHATHLRRSTTAVAHRRRGTRKLHSWAAR
mmetsp:Transcript_16660/g.42606  ORF Transcript_16660/g.42606 Transcript_16660/m.42606 type:complete len:202 (-) Transcript_16660:2557-3162(-)